MSKVRTTPVASPAELERMTLIDMFEQWADDPLRVAFRDERGDLTFADLGRLARDLAARLLSHDPTGRRPVGYLGKQRNEFYLVMVAAAYAGLPFVGFNWRLTSHELSFVLGDAEPSVLVAEREFIDLARTSLGDAECHVVEATGLDVLQKIPLREAPRPLPTITADQCLLVVYTSGTTGRPKGVMLSHRNVVLSISALAAVAEVGSESRVLVQSPTFHVSGNVFSLVGPTQGGMACLQTATAAEELLPSVHRQSITHVALVPTVLRAVLDAERAAPGALKSLRCIVYGAAPIEPSLLAAATRQLSCVFAQSFGLSEAVGVLTMLSPADHDPMRPHLLASVGTALPWTELRVVAPGTSTDVSPGEVGELWARGPRVMLGYWRAPSLTAEAVVDGGWLRTGDLVRVDREQYYYLEGRLKDMIVSGGENVYAAEVENTLLAHPDVDDVAVVGRPDDKWGEVPVAFVVSTGEIDEQALIAHCRSLIAGYKCPAAVVRVAALPRNETGKLLKNELRASLTSHA